MPGSGGDESNNPTLFYYGDQGVGQTILGKDEAREIEKTGQLLTSPDVGSLVIDNLCYHAGGKNVAVAIFFFDFATQKNSPCRIYWASC